MLRWILGGREAPGAVEKSPVMVIGEEQPKNVFTELQVLKGHYDIVRFLVQIDDLRFASGGDDGLVLVWNIQTGECLQELRGHTQQITAVAVYSGPTDGTHVHLLTASSDRALSMWDPDTGNRVKTVSDLLSSAKCLLVLHHLDLWISGGNEMCMWDRNFSLLWRTDHHSDAGISAMIELPKNCIAAAVDKEIVIYRLNIASSEEDTTVSEICRLTDHQDSIRALISVSDQLFVSGSHVGELIVWDSLNWSVQASERILWGEPRPAPQAEIKLGAQKQSEMSVRHLASDGELIVAAVGSGLYVYNVMRKSVVAYRKTAHDSNVLHTLLLPDGQLMSCSEDGSVRMWELQDLPLPAEPASAGFFGMWTFGRSSKQTNQTMKKAQEILGLRMLELTGDLIGHSGAVQMFISMGERGLVTCSTDHLVIAWKNGKRESQLRSFDLFCKLEQNGGL
ncbi:WD repeat-containing protein 41 [Scleropages formosus]|nr:WD repeat-containing protein 41 [Scleropages formosus]XP_018592147.1 WD repeat-containing protein 41 [Scleropages formosus]XP_018592149.1 WD repeat-containing protein 41 [Scleropages formosus]